MMGLDGALGIPASRTYKYELLTVDPSSLVAFSLNLIDWPVRLESKVNVFWNF
jgi:hypothetical protein